MADFCKNFKNGAPKLLRPPSSNFWTLNPNLKSILRYSQNFSQIQPFILAKMAEFFEILEIGAVILSISPRSYFSMLSLNLNSVLQNF